MKFSTSRKKDLKDLRVGRLVCLGRVPSECSGPSKYVFMCDCGTRIILTPERRLHNRVQSCGCLWLESIKDANTKHGHCASGVRSGESRTWQGMLSRCRSETNPRWEAYGGRGIKVCERWLDFANFLEDMGPRPSPKHSLDRVNPNGNYCPENCRWATSVEQQNNRRNNRTIDFNGVSQTVAEWSRQLGMKYMTLVSRLNRGWSVEKALTIPAYGEPIE